MGSYPSLTPNALEGLRIFGRVFRKMLDKTCETDERPKVKLAVTSMTRTVEYQKGLVDSGKLAVNGSTHSTGNAFDIDWSGYYVTGAMGLRPVMDPRRYPGRKYPAAYDRRIPDAAYKTAQLLRTANIINYVPEYPGTENACLHICVTPNASAVFDYTNLDFERIRVS